MKTSSSPSQAKKKDNSKNSAVANGLAGAQNEPSIDHGVNDSRDETKIQEKLSALANNNRPPSIIEQLPSGPIQRKKNLTGLPDQLKSGVESLSGLKMDDVKVHYNSPEPSRLNAHAYAQGSHVYLATGQEKHLSHESWHVVQQKQGKVKPTLQLKTGHQVNDDPILEREADEMGAKALTINVSKSAETANEQSSQGSNYSIQQISKNTIQRIVNIGGTIYSAGGQPRVNLNPAPGAAHTPQQTALVDLMFDSAETYTFFNQGAFDTFVNKGVAPAPAVTNAAATAAALAAPVSKWSFISELGAVRPAAYLAGDVNKRIVLTGENKIDIRAVHQGMLSYGQVIITSATPNEVVVAWLAARHPTVASLPLGGVAGWVPHPNKAIITNPQERGDMHDVRIALIMDPNLKVIFAQSQPVRRGEADDILGYYAGFAGRVAVVGDTVQNIRGQLAPARRHRGVSASTQIILDHAQGNANRAGAVAVMADATTGAMTPARTLAYNTEFANRGFAPGGQYVIINYRDSGHNTPPNRAPSHPELDTGTTGIWDLVGIVQARGFTPVIMGDPPAAPAAHAALVAPGGANLVQYYRWPQCNVGLGTPNGAIPKRLAEYGLLRALNAYTNIRALSFRSGVTDALVYAGIRTISIDLAAERFTQPNLAPANLNGGSGSAGSWRRAAKREAIAPGTFHQGFLTTPRPDAAPPPAYAGAMPAGAGAGSNNVAIDAMVGTHFGTAAAPETVKSLETDPNSPIANITQSATDIRNATISRGYQGPAIPVGAGMAAWATNRATQLRNSIRNRVSNNYAPIPVIAAAALAAANSSQGRAQRQRNALSAQAVVWNAQRVNSRTLAGNLRATVNAAAAAGNAALVQTTLLNMEAELRTTSFLQFAHGQLQTRVVAADHVIAATITL